MGALCPRLHCFEEFLRLLIRSQAHRSFAGKGAVGAIGAQGLCSNFRLIGHISVEKLRLLDVVIEELRRRSRHFEMGVGFGSAAVFVRLDIEFARRLRHSFAEGRFQREVSIAAELQCEGLAVFLELEGCSKAQYSSLT